MLELLAKLGLLSMAGGALVFSDRAAAAHVLPVVLCGSLVALGCWLADRKGARNEGVAGLFAVADSAVIAVLLTLGGLADHLGFLTLAPIALAAARFGSLPTAMAPIAAAALVSAHGVLLGGPPRAALYAQALGVLTIGILLNHRRIVVTVTRDVVGPIQPLAPQEPDGFLALRENFRKLKDSYRDLERKSRRDRLTSALLESRLLGGSSFFSRLAQRLKEISGAESVMLYGVAERDGRLVVRSSSGAAPESLTDAALEVVLDSGPLHLMESASRSIAALLNDEERPHFATVPLFHEGNVIGMAVAYHSRKSHLDECRACLEETSSVAAAMIVEEADRSAQRLRLKELETLYALACVSAGAGTANTLAARVARELKSTLEVDHVGIHWVDDGESIAASIEGLKAKFLDALSFAEGSGLQGWLSTGSPELVMLSTAEDARCTPEITLKRRVGSFCLFPIYVSNEVTGYITAATKRALGIDGRGAEVLRMAAAEMGRALSRLESLPAGPEGLATAAEFQNAVESSSDAVLIVLEPLKKSVEAIGPREYEKAAESFTKRLVARLPSGALMLRRSSGELLVLMREVEESFARSWANDLCATAAMMGVKTLSGESAPLAFRSKVAKLTKADPAKSSSPKSVIP